MRVQTYWCYIQVLFVVGCFLPSLAFGSSSVSDSVKVEKLLSDARRLPSDSCRTLFFAFRFLNVPYVAQTLDDANGVEERLVVHLDKMDCTTFVETVLALTWCDKIGKETYDDYKQALQLIRYRNGIINGYISRLHYFSDWIKDNERKGIVKERTTESVCAELTTLNLSFMSNHADSYPALKVCPVLMDSLLTIEGKWKNIPVSYIPKRCLNASLDKLQIQNGDVLAITTSIEGLDVVHTGFAYWVGEKLHLLHASSVAKKVILDPIPLFDYCKNKKGHTGIRVVSFLKEKRNYHSELGGSSLLMMTINVPFYYCNVPFSAC